MANVAKGQDRPVALRVGKFLRESRAELRKVTWPNRKELITYTVVVIVSTAIVAVFFGIVDLDLFSAFGLARQDLRGSGPMVKRSDCTKTQKSANPLISTSFSISTAISIKIGM